MFKGVYYTFIRMWNMFQQRIVQELCLANTCICFVYKIHYCTKRNLRIHDTCGAYISSCSSRVDLINTYQHVVDMISN